MEPSDWRVRGSLFAGDVCLSIRDFSSNCTETFTNWLPLYIHTCCSLGFKCLCISEWFGFFFFFCKYLDGKSIHLSSSIINIILAIFYDKWPYDRLGAARRHQNFRSVHVGSFVQRKKMWGGTIDYECCLPGWHRAWREQARCLVIGVLCPISCPQSCNMSICAGTDEPGRRGDSQPSVMAAGSLAPKTGIETLVEAMDP